MDLTWRKRWRRSRERRSRESHSFIHRHVIGLLTHKELEHTVNVTAKDRIAFKTFQVHKKKKKRFLSDVNV